MTLLCSQDHFRAMSSRYPSDPLGAEWKRIEPIFDRFRFDEHNPRELINAVFYLVKSGCQWRMLPDEFPPWQTVYYHFRKWREMNLLPAALRPDSAGRPRSRWARPKSQCGGHRYPVGPCRAARWSGPRPRLEQANNWSKAPRDRPCGGAASGGFGASGQ